MIKVISMTGMINMINMIGGCHVFVIAGVGIKEGYVIRRSRDNGSK